MNSISRYDMGEKQYVDAMNLLSEPYGVVSLRTSKKRNLKLHQAILGWLIGTVLMAASACGTNKPVTPVDSAGNSSGVQQGELMVLKPDVTFQKMIGFGGALSWYCSRITDSPRKKEMIRLLFNDLGTDILRLKNWYYPEDYPANKSPDRMAPSYFSHTFEATDELYNLAKTATPNLQVLLSSWGPPPALKSNGKLNEGTLAKNADGSFKYDEFAAYWQDVLDHIGFSPDYISIQNEPSYTNPGWETCKWAPTERADYPGYKTAFEKVHERIKDRPDQPVMIGPEAANLGSGDFGKTFESFADPIKRLSYLKAYAWHPYNFNDSTRIGETTPRLDMIREDYGDRPNIMTEYSGMDWFQTAEFINNAVTHANASAYIYWEMAWDAGSNQAMMRINESGSYLLTPFYYVMKHFAKFVDAGYKRIEVSSGQQELESSAFISPSGDRITLIAINPSDNHCDISLRVSGKSSDRVRAWQSTPGLFWSDKGETDDSDTYSLPGRSITTFVLDLN